MMFTSIMSNVKKKHSAQNLVQLQPLGRTEQPLVLFAAYGPGWHNILPMHL